MADREQPYDPYIPSGANGSQQGGNSRTAALQAVSRHLYSLEDPWTQAQIDRVLAGDL